MPRLIRVLVVRDDVLDPPGKMAGDPWSAAEEVAEGVDGLALRERAVRAVVRHVHRPCGDVSNRLRSTCSPRLPLDAVGRTLLPRL